MAHAFPGSERCVICNRLIDDPADDAAMGRIVEDHLHPLHVHNHAHFHRTCLAVWPHLAALVDQLERLNAEAGRDDGRLSRTVTDLVSLRSGGSRVAV